MRLDNYYVHPTCSPTRAALLTGRYAANLGISVAFVPGNPGGLSPTFPTLTDQLDTMGYRSTVSSLLTLFLLPMFLGTTLLERKGYNQLSKPRLEMYV